MFLQQQLKTLLPDGSQGVPRYDARNLQRSWRKSQKKGLALRS